MAKVVELVAEVFYLAPACVASPVVRIARVLCTGSIEVTVGLLSRCDDIQYAVDVELELLVGVGLQDVAGTLDGLVGVSVVERVSYAVYLEHH